MNKFVHKILNTLYKPLAVPRMGAFFRALICALGVACYFVFHSAYFLIFGAAVFIDFINSILIYYAVRQSSRSVDIGYNYGGGKFESIAFLWSLFALAQVSLMGVLYRVNLTECAGGELPLAVYFLISAIAFYTMQKIQYLSARHNNLSLIASESYIFGGKIPLEFIPIITLILGGALKNLTKLEPAIIDTMAIYIFLFALLIRPFLNLKSAFEQLTDKPLPEEMQYEILAVITENIDKFCQFKAFYTRSSGADIFIEIDVIMPWDFTLESIYKVEKLINKEIIETFPNAKPRVYVTPCKRDCIHQDKINCPVKKRIMKRIDNG